ncbi:hypothetical protein [Brevundimonas nasdae]|uniref:hypothetical protein n=1 Tax=Brevundimonas nasdae TaxID=172043 RepID=UPI001FD0D1AB|nr:hypothetical protein [Brevundimonas nasdae]
MSAVQVPLSPPRRGRRPDPVVLHPVPLWEVTADPGDFHHALDVQMRRHGDTTYRLRKAILACGLEIDPHAITAWRTGAKTPQTPNSLAVLAAIERRYRLDPGYFDRRMGRWRALVGHAPKHVGSAESRRLAWHLPDDFQARSPLEQAKILDWVRTRVLSGGTEFRRYQSEMSRHKFGLRFDGNGPCWLQAPARLKTEMADLVRFKSNTLTEIGSERSGVWGEATAVQRTEHLALMLGALAAPVDGPVKGFGLARGRLTLGLLVFPTVWDWYVQWREQRRGFFAGWEAEMLLLGAAFTRERTGWIRQRPSLIEAVEPIEGLITSGDVERAQADWPAACERAHRHTLARYKEISRVARIHRDPFEPILPILEAQSPVGEYRKIAEEILARVPDRRRHPRQAAEAIRSFLMIRFGLHLGLRQKNLRELLVCLGGAKPRSERELERRKRGELRWSERDDGWEVFIPYVAFKNAGSAYFSKRPYRLVLPDLGGLYGWIEDYLANHRPALLKGAADPETFFVKTVKVTSRSAEFSQSGFYEAWRITIQRYGIFNPWTERGAISGLLSHGPHSVRDVLATHVLKLTGSYEQASYAIQDTPATVAAHYGRFLPQDKAALAAKLLNEVWAA